MKAHADSGLVQTAVGSTAKLGDARVCDQLLHGDEPIVLGDRGYSSQARRIDAPREEGQPLYAMPYRRKRRRDLPDQREANASLRAKVEHPFLVLKRQFGYTQVRYRGLEKNTAQRQPTRQSSCRRPTAAIRYFSDPHRFKLTHQSCCTRH